MIAAFEVRERGLHEEHRAAQIDVERLLPRFGRELTEGLGQRVGGVVDHDVDAAERVDRSLDESRECIELAHVRRDADRLGPQPPQVLFGFRAGIGFAAPYNDAGPRAGEALRNRAADPAGSAGHDHDAVTDVEQPGEFRLVHRGDPSGASPGPVRKPRNMRSACCRSRWSSCSRPSLTASSSRRLPAPIAAVNSQLCLLSGYTPEELIDAPIETLDPLAVSRRACGASVGLRRRGWRSPADVRATRHRDAAPRRRRSARRHRAQHVEARRRAVRDRDLARRVTTPACRRSWRSKSICSKRR